MFYLAKLVGSGRRGDYFRAPESEDMTNAFGVPIIDLRDDVTRPDGYALAYYPERPSRFALDRLTPIGDGPARSIRLPDKVACLIPGADLGETFRRFAGSQLWARGLQPNPASRHWEVWLGGHLLWAMPQVAGGSSQFQDETFNTADSTTLGPDLAWTEIKQNWAIASNAVTCDGSSTMAYARADYDLRTQNHYAQASLTTLSGSADRSAGVLTRFSASATNEATTTAYQLEINELNNRYALTRIINGTGTGISGFVGLGTWPGLPNTVKLQSLGSTHQVYFPLATYRAAYTDTNIITNRRAGLSLYNSNSLCRIDSFRAGCFTPDYTFM